MTISLIYATFFIFYITKVVGWLDINLMKGLSVFNLCLYLLLFVWIFKIVKRRKIFLSNNINIYLILMCLVIILSSFVKIFQAEVHFNLIQEVISFKRWVNPVLLFWILFNIIDDDATNDKVLVGLAILYFGFSIAQVLAIHGVIDYRADKILEQGRVGGLGAAGEYSIMLSLFFPFSLTAAFFLGKRFFSKYFFFLLSCLMLVGYAYAGSRNGVVTLLTATSLYFILINRFLSVKVYWLLLLLVALMAIGYSSFILAPDYLQESVTGKFEHEQAQNIDSYSSGRTRFWASGWTLFLDSPIFGHGGKTFATLLQKKTSETKSIAAHNEYLKHLVEYGLVGFTVFILLYVKIVQNVWRALKATSSRSRKFIYSSYLAGLISFMIGMFFTNAGSNLYIFWIYTAIVYKYIQLESTRELTIDCSLAK